MTADLFFIVFPFWIKAFLLTLVMEIPIFVLIGKKGVLEGEKISIPKLASAGALGTCITHPLLWFAWPLVVHNYMLYIITGEIIVAVFEVFSFYLFARHVKFKYAALASLTANAFSFGLGALIQYLFV